MNRVKGQITRSRIIRTCAAAALLAGMFTAMSAAAQVQTVGPGSNCDHSDLQAAIDAIANEPSLPPGISVVLRLSSDDSHFQGNYEIDMSDLNNDLIIRGGHETCNDSSSSGRTNIRAANSGSPFNGRAFNILYDVADSAEPRRVRLENLAITDGEMMGSGAGIRISGHSGRQRVHLVNTMIHDNHTLGDGNHGGGIELSDTAGPNSDKENIWLSIDHQSPIFNNTASGGFGGGIHCLNPGGGGTGQIRISGIINSNVASGGGGIAAGGCTIESSGRVMNNSATGTSSDPFDYPGNGGGIFLIGGATMVLSSDSTQVHLRNNDALSQGGGAYIRDEGTKLELIDVEVTGNHADFAGGGLYIDDGSELNMNRSPNAGCPGFECSRLSENTAHGDGGGALGLRNARAIIRNTFIQDNVGTNLASAVLAGGGLNDGPEAYLGMESVVISGNHGADNLFWGTRTVLFETSLSTITGNRQQDSELTLFELVDPNNQAIVAIRYSILWEPGNVPIVESSGSSHSFASCVIGHGDASDIGISATEFYSHIDPAFENPNSGDFRLSSNSPAIDYCDGSHFKGPPPGKDLSNRPRGVPYDLPIIEPPNALGGNFDLGAHERQPDAMFRDRFENQ